MTLFHRSAPVTHDMADESPRLFWLFTALSSGVPAAWLLRGRFVTWRTVVLSVSLAAGVGGVGCDSPSSPDRAGVVFPGCTDSQRMSLVPNYASEIDAETTPRWERFPLRVFLEPALEPFGLKPVRTGLQAWSLATGGRVGTVTLVSVRDNADVIVASVSPLGGHTAGRALYEQVDSNPSGNDIIRRARIEYSIDILQRCAPSGQAVCDRIVQTIAAHEMGHVLGLGGGSTMSHTSFPGSLMQPSPENTVDPISADVNTVLIKYGC